MNKPYYLLKFGTDRNREFTLRINNAKKEGIAPAIVSSCMNDLIANDPFDTEKGALSTAKGAQLVSCAVKAFSL